MLPESTLVISQPNLLINHRLSNQECELELLGVVFKRRPHVVLHQTFFVASCLRQVIDNLLEVFHFQLLVPAAS